MLNYVSRTKLRAHLLLKSSKNEKIRHIYLRITVDGIPKETSTKRKWYPNRWDQKEGKAIGTKEDARTINLFLNP